MIKNSALEPWEYFNRDYERNPYQDDMAILTRPNAKTFYCDDEMSLQHWIQAHNGTCTPSIRQYPCD